MACQAMSMAISMVFPEPVAILLHRRRNGPPSLGIVMPTLTEAGASASQMSVSMASIWQKKNLSGLCSGSRQWSRRRLVMPVTPGYPASRQILTRERIWFTRGSSMKTPGSSKEREASEATM